MNKPPKKKNAKLFSPRYDGLWMILLPLIAIGCCALLLIPQISALMEYARADSASITAEVTDEYESKALAGMSIAPSLQDREWDACPPDSRCLILTATSSERDMSVVVRDENNNVVTGQPFPVTLTAPTGDSADYVTKTDGSCYIVELMPGEYTVSMRDTPGYISAEPIKCTVLDRVAYAPIQNISQVIDIVDIGEISLSEVKAQPSAASQPLVVPEIIITPPEAFSENTVFSEQQEIPVTDSLGHQVYSYTVHLGPGGHLLYRGTDQESDVLPVDENDDNIPEYGLRYETPAQTEIVLQAADGENAGEANETQLLSAPAESGYYISVALFNADNTPVELYAIDAVPLTEQADIDRGIGGWKQENGHTCYYGADGQKEVGLKNIDGKLYYFNSRGEKASSLGIDVSCFNGHINWKAVRAQGIDFALMRVGGRGWSSGLVYEDTFLQENLAGARSAGIRTGVYFYSTAISTVEAVQEASVVLEKLRGTHLDYPVFIDMEYSGSYPNGRADELPTALRVDIANAFCRTVISGGYAAGIYASEYYMTSCMDYRSISQYSYWLANYTENNAMPGFSGRYDIWQFTNAGQMNGISGTVDLNVIF